MNQKTHIGHASVAVASAEDHRLSWMFVLGQFCALWEAEAAREPPKQCSINCDSRKPQRHQSPRSAKLAMTGLVARGV